MNSFLIKPIDNISLKDLGQSIKNQRSEVK